VPKINLAASEPEAAPPQPTEPEPTGGNGSGPTTPGDAFDRLDSLRLRQSFDRVKTRKPLTTVGIRKPKAHEWFQTHSAYRYDGTLFEAQEEGIRKDWFFPTSETVIDVLERLSPTGVKNVAVFWWINRKKNTFIWPVILTDADGRQNEWHASMLEMLTVHSRGAWCRIEAADGGYNPTIAGEEDEGGEDDGTVPEPPPPPPEWPVTKSFGEVLRVAFKKGGRVVDSLDHPLIKRLKR
jgi:hypothetical protein